MILIGPGDTEAVSGGPQTVMAEGLVSARGTQVCGMGAITASAHPASFTVSGGPGTAVARRTLIAGVTAVLDPFRHIAVYIVEAKGIRLKTAHSHGPLGRLPCSASGISVFRVVIRLLGGDGCAGRKRRGSAGTCNVLPLRFGKQPVGFAGFARQPLHVLLGFAPCYFHGRLPAAAPAFVVVRRAGRTIYTHAAAVADTGIPFGESYLELPRRERACNRHRMLWPFVIAALCLARW